MRGKKKKWQESRGLLGWGGRCCSVLLLGLFLPPYPSWALGQTSARTGRPEDPNHCWKCCSLLIASWRGPAGSKCLGIGTTWLQGTTVSQAVNWEIPLQEGKAPGRWSSVGEMGARGAYCRNALLPAPRLQRRQSQLQKQQRSLSCSYFIFIWCEELWKNEWGKLVWMYTWEMHQEVVGRGTQKPSLILVWY